MAGSAARGTPAGNTLTSFGTPGGAAGMAGGKGGSANTVPPASAPAAAQGQYAPMAQPTGGFDVNQAGASALQQAIGGTQRAIGGTGLFTNYVTCLLYTSPSPRDGLLSRMPSSA